RPSRCRKLSKEFGYGKILERIRTRPAVVTEKLSITIKDGKGSATTAACQCFLPKRECQDSSLGDMLIPRPFF
ncbi:hypothetical protein, partial [Paenibacillus sp. YK5]